MGPTGGRSLPARAVLRDALVGLILVLAIGTGCIAETGGSTDPVDGPRDAALVEGPRGSELAAAIEETRAELFAEPFARSSPLAIRSTEEFLSGLIGSAWRIAHHARYLQKPDFSASSGIVGLPGLFNPDNRYAAALLDPDGVYRIRGTRGSHYQLTLQFLDSYPLVALSKDLLVIDLDRLGLEPGEDFELSFGGEEVPGLWWPMPVGARAVLVRQTFNDWQGESPSAVAIDRLDETSDMPSGAIHADLAARYLRQAAELWSGRYLAQLRRLPKNAMAPLRPSAGVEGGLTGQQGVMGRYELSPEQALIVTVRASDAGYQAIQLGDDWFVTPNPLRHQSSLNRSQSRVDRDGNLRFVVSLTDPGVANWLDPGGHPSGYIFLRWQGIRTALDAVTDQPRTEVVALSELDRRLPADTARITEEGRGQQLETRSHLPALR